MMKQILPVRASPAAWNFRLFRTIEDEVDAPAEVGRRMEWVITASEWNTVH